MSRHRSRSAAPDGGSPSAAIRRLFRWKRLVIVLGSLITVLAVAIGALFAWLWTDAKVSTVGKASFDNALAIPPLAESIVEKDGTRVFALSVSLG